MHIQPLMAFPRPAMPFGGHHFSRPDFHGAGHQPDHGHHHGAMTSVSLMSSSTQVFTYNRPQIASPQMVAASGSPETTVAAQKILDFVATQLEKDIADGLEKSEIESRLQAGLDGFLQGYNEALEELGELPAAVMAEIEKTKEDVFSGFRSLADQYDLTVPTGVPEIEDTDAPSKVTSIDASQTAIFESSNRSFSLRLKTQDGDTVTIRADSSKMES